MKKFGFIKHVAFFISFLLALILFTNCVVKPSPQPSTTPMPAVTPIAAETPTNMPQPTQPSVHSPAPSGDYSNGDFPCGGNSYVFPTSSDENSPNYFAIPDAILPCLTTADCEAYVKIVDAFMNYETSITVESDTNFLSVLNLVELCFPVFYADVYDSAVSISNDSISWEYNASREEHEAYIARFEENVSEYLSLVRSGGIAENASEIMKILTIYTEFCSNICYSYESQDFFHGEIELAEADYKNHCFDALYDSTGVCWCYARAYAFLLNQIGVEALSVCADGGIGHHEWTMFRYAGSWFFADPTWDMNSSNIFYFGMTTKARESAGYYEDDMMFFAGAAFPVKGNFELADNRFMPLWAGTTTYTEYKLDYENNCIDFYDTFAGLIQKKVGSFSLDFDGDANG